MAVNLEILNKLDNEIQKLKQSINLCIKQSIEANKDRIVELQTQQQLYLGKTNKGVDIIPAYAESTKRRKRKDGLPSNRVTLYQTGNLYRSFRVLAGNESVVISAYTEYSEYVFDKYKDTIGLDRENWNNFINEYTLKAIKIKFNDIITKS